MSRRDLDGHLSPNRFFIRVRERTSLRFAKQSVVEVGFPYFIDPIPNTNAQKLSVYPLQLLF
jgi:hypothetical protein